MDINLSGLLLKKISTSFSLILISFLAFIVGAYVITKAQKLEKLQKPLPFYVSIEQEEVRPPQN